jgi:K+-transporting ATPase KdpF subunit
MNKLLTILILIVSGSESIAQNAHDTPTQNLIGYTLAAIIAIAILCYLLYALFKPEKF